MKAFFHPILEAFRQAIATARTQWKFLGTGFLALALVDLALAWTRYTLDVEGGHGFHQAMTLLLFGLVGLLEETLTGAVALLLCWRAVTGRWLGAWRFLQLCALFFLIQWLVPFFGAFLLDGLVTNIWLAVVHPTVPFPTEFRPAKVTVVTWVVTALYLRIVRYLDWLTTRHGPAGFGWLRPAVYAWIIHLPFWIAKWPVGWLSGHEAAQMAVMAARDVVVWPLVTLAMVHVYHLVWHPATQEEAAA